MSNSSYTYASGTKGQDISDVLVIQDKLILSKNITEQTSSLDTPLLLKNPFYGVSGDGTADREYLSLNQYIHKFSGDSAWVMYSNYLKTIENDYNILMGNNVSSDNTVLNDTKIFMTESNGTLKFKDNLLNNSSNCVYRKCPLGTSINKPFRLYVNSNNTTNGIYSSGESMFNDMRVFGSMKSFKLEVGNSTSLISTLEVAKSVTLNKELSVGGITSLKSLLKVANSTSLNSTLYVDKAATFNNSLTCKIIDLTGSLDLKSTLTVKKSVTLDSTLNVGKSLTIAEDTKINGSVDVSGAVTVDKTLYVGQTTNLEGSVSLTNTLNVKKASTLNSTLCG